MRLLPRPRRVVLLSGGHIDRVVQPGMPGRRDLRRLGESAVDHPAARAAPLLVIDVTEPVVAHAHALAPSIDARADGVARPPGKELGEDSHGWFGAVLCRCCARTMGLGPAPVKPTG